MKIEYNIQSLDCIGDYSDVDLLSNHHWLSNAIVDAQLYYQKGKWKIKFHFVSTEKSINIFCLYLENEFESISRAEVYANYYLKTIQKNFGNQLPTKNNDYNICYN